LIVIGLARARAFFTSVPGYTECAHRAPERGRDCKAAKFKDSRDCRTHEDPRTPTGGKRPSRADAATEDRVIAGFAAWPK